MICDFNHVLCFVELAVSGVVLGFTFGVGSWLWGKLAPK
jgi:hypothetical protein